MPIIKKIEFLERSFAVLESKIKNIGRYAADITASEPTVVRKMELCIQLSSLFQT